MEKIIFLAFLLLCLFYFRKSIPGIHDIFGDRPLSKVQRIKLAIKKIELIDSLEKNILLLLVNQNLSRAEISMRLCRKGRKFHHAIMGLSNINLVEAFETKRKGKPVYQLNIDKLFTLVQQYE